MKKHAWVKGFAGAITITDNEGTIIEMNEEAAKRLYGNDGGYALLGQNAIDCHPYKSQEKVRKIYETQSINLYSITKNGQKYLVYQSSYLVKGKFSGIVEMSLELPDEIPHFDRDHPKK